jgi:hypothetical protein
MTTTEWLDALEERSKEIRHSNPQERVVIEGRYGDRMLVDAPDRAPELSPIVTPREGNLLLAAYDAIVNRSKENTMSTQPSNYDHLIPSVDETTSAIRLHMILGQVLPRDMHNLLIHVIAKAEQIGEQNGRLSMRTNREERA